MREPQSIEISLDSGETASMEQQNFRVKFSLGTKLVLCLSLLFIVVVGFLSYSAVKLVVEDKQAYTFQLQSMEAYIAGQDFTEKVRPAIDNLRLYLTAFDPRLPINAVQAQNLKNLVKSQVESGYFAASLVKCFRRCGLSSGAEP